METKTDISDNFNQENSLESTETPKQRLSQNPQAGLLLGFAWVLLVGILVQILTKFQEVQ